MDAFSDQRENALNPVRDIPPRNSESTPIPEEHTAQTEESSLNVDALLWKIHWNGAIPPQGYIHALREEDTQKSNLVPRIRYTLEGAWTTPRWSQAR